MPIVACPGCSATLNAPETAVGKKIRCPKCQTVTPIPAPVIEFDDVEPEPAPSDPKRPLKTAPRRARNADADEDRPRKRDDDDEDDWPRKKGGRGPKAGGVPPVLLFGGIAAALLVVGLAVCLFVFRDRTGDGTAAQSGPGEPPAEPPGPSGPDNVRAAPPESWKEFVSERDGFKAYFAGGPEIGSTVQSSRSVGGRGQPYYRDYSYRSQPSWADLALTVRVFEFPETSTPQQQQTFADQVCTPSPADTGETVTGRGTAALGGVEGKEVVGEARVSTAATDPKTTRDGRPMPSKLVSVNRWIVANNKCYYLKVQGHNTRPKDAAAFFDNFALTNPPAPKPKSGGGPPEPKEPPKPVVVPAGWVAYRPAGAGFGTVAPTGIKVTDATTPLPSKRGQPMLRSVTLHRVTDADGVVYEARVVQFSPVVESWVDQINAIREVVNAPVYEKHVRLGRGAPKPVTWAGKTALEWTYGAGQGVVRETHTATGGFTAAVYAQQGAPDSEKVRAFLDSFEFTN